MKLLKFDLCLLWTGSLESTRLTVYKLSQEPPSASGELSILRECPQATATDTDLAGFYQLFDAIFELIANFIQFEGYFEDRRPSSNCDPYSGKCAPAAALFPLFLFLTLLFSH